MLKELAEWLQCDPVRDQAAASNKLQEGYKICDVYGAPIDSEMKVSSAWDENQAEVKVSIIWSGEKRRWPSRLGHFLNLKKSDPSLDLKNSVRSRDMNNPTCGSVRSRHSSIARANYDLKSATCIMYNKILIIYNLIKPCKQGNWEMLQEIIKLYGLWKNALTKYLRRHDARTNRM